MNQHEAFGVALSAVDWTVFCTLTFRGVEPSERRALELGAEWLKWVAHVERKPAGGEISLLRRELGETGGRLHLHALIQLKPENVGLFVAPEGCLSVAHTKWDRGMTTFRRYTSSGGGDVSYCLKASEAGADSYEFRKSCKAVGLILSSGLEVWLNRRQRVIHGALNSAGSTLAEVPQVACLRP
jgi:hypothetical protein